MPASLCLSIQHDAIPAAAITMSTLTQRSNTILEAISTEPSSADNPRIPASFITLAVETRLQIYDLVFVSQEKVALRRRDGIDDEKVMEALSNTFNTTILTTCRRVYQEALPFFYSSQIFHYSINSVSLCEGSLVGDSHNMTSCERHGAHPFFSNHLNLLVHLSLDLEINDWETADKVLSDQMAFFNFECPKLGTVTVHLFHNYDRLNSVFRRHGATAKELRVLLSRVERLTIVTFGKWDAIRELRLGITEGDVWQPKVHDDWPYMTPTEHKVKRMAGQRADNIEFGMELPKIQAWATDRDRLQQMK